GELVRAGGELVLLLAADAEPRVVALRRLPHGDLVEGAEQTIVRHRVDQRAVAVLVALARTRQQVRGVGHGLHSACDDDVVLDAGVEFYVATFGLAVAGRETNEDQGVREAMLHVTDGPGGASYVQLLEPLGADTPVGKFLAQRGEGVHHIGYGVTDVAAELDR